MSLGSHFSQSRLRSIAVAFSMVLAGVGLFSVGSAHADAIANSATVDLGNYGISASPPKYIPHGDNIPTVQGTLGNATDLFVGAGYENTNQVMSVQNGSIAWGTPVVTSVADGKGSSSQQWYFQLIGWIDMHTPMQNVAEVHNGPDWNAGDLDKVPVFRILNYNGSSITCLDAYGGAGAVDSAVDSYGCDPNQANQTNQLWVISYPHPAGELGDEVVDPSDQQSDQPYLEYLGQYPQYSSALQTSFNGAGVIENVASLAANGWDTTQAPVLTASFSDLAGFNSPLKLESQTTWPTLSENSTWGVVDPNAGSGSGSGGGQSPTCTGFACLINPN
jgi:hypothetical protein